MGNAENSNYGFMSFRRFLSVRLSETAGNMIKRMIKYNYPIQTCNFMMIKCRNFIEGKENIEMERERFFAMPFSRIYPLYIQKAERKARTKDEVNEIIYWLTGYDEHSLQQQIDSGVNLETFFKQAPSVNPNASLIKGIICGHRVEEIEDELMRQIRYLDKLIDELAKGKTMEKILRK